MYVCSVRSESVYCGKRLSFECLQEYKFPSYIVFERESNKINYNKDVTTTLLKRRLSTREKDTLELRNVLGQPPCITI